MKVLKIVFPIAACVALICCLVGCSSQTQESTNFSVTGAYHALTGNSDPTDFGPGLSQNEIEQGISNLKEGELNADTKKIFVVAELKADEKENIEVGDPTPLTTGEYVSDAKLIIDDANEYNDNYVLNKSNKGYCEALNDLGYKGGEVTSTLYANSDPYKVVFLFFVGNNDLENGTTAKLEWGDYQTEFSIADIQEVETPMDMVSALQ